MDTKSSLENRIDTVSQDLNLLRVEHRILTERVKSAEEVLNELNPMASDNQKQIQRLEAEVKILWRWVEEAEVRSRRNNVRFLGFPEKLLEQSTEIFLEQWLIKEVLNGVPSKFFSMERAHRVPRRPPAPGQPPRSLIARFLNYRDRNAILQQFCNKGPFRYEYSVVNAYADFTQEVQRQPNSYAKTKQRLHEHNIKYALLFTAKLRVISDDRTHVFTSPEDAWMWLHAKGLTRSQEGTDEGEEWLISPSQKCSKKRPKGQPTEKQAAEERAKVLKETPLLTQNSFEALRALPVDSLESDSASSDSTLTDVLKGPKLTPRSADAL
ncbi:hypothetical protein NDU88_005923 [Pleurodeles waltl]|uniref:Uncharacterized protein n=1 Tax=Pleurodeles waltl TaxID=8319 RepID=A0AAV7LP48_PLEWA|nr:hypothetical protein NDU88_005923 [Pleurodeles waltl]